MRSPQRLQCAVLCSLLTLISGQGPTESTVSTQGSTQIYQPPPTVLFGPPSCFYFNSLTNVSRTCTLISSCFSYIRRQSDGTFRIKKGCGSNCQNTTRGRKVQVCCSTHLCNTGELSEANFTTDEATSLPRPQCYQSHTNGTCELTTACFSQLRYQSDETYQLLQGCVTGSECTNQSDAITVKRCCTSHLCNIPIPPSAHPRNNPVTPNNIATPTTVATPIFSSPSASPVPSDSPPTTSIFVPPMIVPSGPTRSFPVCHCDDCPAMSCQGLFCARVITYTPHPLPLINYTCLQDATSCNQAVDPSPIPGTVTVTCCTSNYCNIELPLPTVRTTPTPRETTTPVHTTATGVTTAGKSPSSPSTATDKPPLAPDDIYFTFTAVVSVVGGLIVVCIILGVLVALIVHIKKRSQKVHLPPRQASPACHMTTCYPVGSRDSPLASSSTSSASSVEIQLKSELLRQLGTSV